MVYSSAKFDKILRLALIPLFSVLFLPLAGCGKTAFNVLATSQNQASPGFFNVPPKVDFLLFVDDTGSMTSSYATIQTEVPKFLSQLESQKWDYHFASNALTTPRTQIPQVAGSVYDSNHSGWLPSYPGQIFGGPDQIVASFFRSLSSADQGTSAAYSDFLTPGQVNAHLAGSEPGFKTMWSTLTQSINGTGFLRPDALLIVMAMGNGNDNSDVTYDSVSVDSTYTTQVPNAASLTTSFNHYLNDFKGFCSSSRSPQCQRLQFYAAVNLYGSSNCLKASLRPTIGQRYMDLADQLGGVKYDICSQSISSVLSQLGNNLKSQKISYKTDYLIIGSDPDPTSIVVKKYLGGDTSQAQVIPMDPNNGWTYVGYVTNQNISEVDGPSGSVTTLNPATGYAIALHGTAKISGNDTASVDFKPAGAQNSVTK